MSEWSSYRLSDFLLFSERVYRRLFETHNEAWWPLPVVIALLGALVVLALARTGSARTAGVCRAAWTVLGLVWLFVAIAFLRARYAPINPLADYAAWAFGAQGLALVAVGLAFPKREPITGWRVVIGLGLCVWGLGYPLQAWLRDGSLDAAEWFGMAPDPTAVATIGIVLTAIRERRLLAALLVVPIVWCVLSLLTLQAMDERRIMGELAAATPVATGRHRAPRSAAGRARCRANHAGDMGSPVGSTDDGDRDEAAPLDAFTFALQVRKEPPA